MLEKISCRLKDFDGLAMDIDVEPKEPLLQVSKPIKDDPVERVSL